jgi:hypothetical protein
VVRLAGLGVVYEEVAGLPVDMRDSARLAALGRDLVADREVLCGELPIIRGGRFLFALCFRGISYSIRRWRLMAGFGTLRGFGFGGRGGRSCRTSQRLAGHRRLASIHPPVDSPQHGRSII